MSRYNDRKTSRSCLVDSISISLLSCTFYVVSITIHLIGPCVLAAESDLYLQHLRPLFVEKCITCHGALRSEAGLRLDAIQFIRAGSESGSIVESDGVAASKLLERVKSKESDFRMPPDDAGTALTRDQVRLMSEWIDSKLPGPDDEPFLNSPQDHWAYQPITKPSLSGSSFGDASNPIDHFIQAAQRAKGLRAIGTASDAAWLRRATFDLRGLPPTFEELNRFVNDQFRNKREVLIDRLLSDSTYGERWGRHWMDIWRYSDWDGYKNELRSSQRHIWHWRDWIIESLNSNKPYDQMIVEMLAADEFAPADPDALRATGFLARNFHNRNRNIWLDATVEHTAKAFLGMTLNCAKCHDHKYDPIPQESYYQFRALFEPHRIRTDPSSGIDDLEQDGIPRVFDDDVDVATYLYVRGNEKNPRKEAPMVAAVPAFIQVPFEVSGIDLPLESFYPALSSIARENAFAAKRQAEIDATTNLQSQLRSLESFNEHKPNLSNSKTRLALATNIEQAASNLKLAMTDRASMHARYAAEEAKYTKLRREQLAENVRPQTAFSNRTFVEPLVTARKSIVSADSGQSQQSIQFPGASLGTRLWCSARTVHYGHWPSMPKVEVKKADDPSWEELAREAAIAEHHHHQAQASHEVLMTRRNLANATNSKEEDAKKHQAAIQTAEAALEKAKAKLEKLASDLDPDVLGYAPVGKEFPRQSTGRRLALAKWMVHPDHPLTARVAINHIWLRHFGTPLVENTFDFGMSSPKPELLDLLNWLSAELIESSWDMKHIHRLILSSEVYAAASDDGDQVAYKRNMACDPENRTYWRANVRRLDAEEVRDSLLAVADVLDDHLFGPDIDFTKGDSIMRRSLYFRHAYEKQMPMLVLFDAASPNECYRRKPSLVPQQALALANSPLARRLAKQLADQCFNAVVADYGLESVPMDRLVDRLFQTAIGRPPTSEELVASVAFLESQTKLLSDPSNLTLFSDKEKSETSEQTCEQRARQSLALVLFNHHDFVSIR